MEYAEVIRRRRMVRAFTPEPVPGDLLDALLDAARRAPSAGNTQPVELVVLEGTDTARFWDVSLPAERRPSFRFRGLIEAPVIVLPVVRPAAYVERYAEDDKVATGLGEGEERWDVPYWWVDGGMAVMTLLHGAVDAGLGASFFGLFAREQRVLAALGVPDDRRGLGVVALGWPAPDEPGRSAARPRRPLDDVVHRGGW